MCVLPGSGLPSPHRGCGSHIQSSMAGILKPGHSLGIQSRETVPLFHGCPMKGHNGPGSQSGEAVYPLIHGWSSEVQTLGSYAGDAALPSSIAGLRSQVRAWVGAHM